MSDDGRDDGIVPEAYAAFDGRKMTAHEIGTWPAYRDGYAAGLVAREPGPATTERTMNTGLDSAGDLRLIAEHLRNNRGVAVMPTFAATLEKIACELDRTPGPDVSRLLAAAKEAYSWSCSIGDTKLSRELGDAIAEHEAATKGGERAAKDQG